MTGLLLALLGTVLAGIGARDQTLMARLAKAQGQRVSALAVQSATLREMPESTSAAAS